MIMLVIKDEPLIKLIKDLFEDRVAAVLDDPHGAEADAEYISQLRQLAEVLDIDFDTLIQQSGSAFEVMRLLQLEQNS